MPRERGGCMSLILKRDGKEVLKGDYFKLLAYIHKNHSYSFSHATKHEGYVVEINEEVN
jgi:hypothetical protein